MRAGSEDSQEADQESAGVSQRRTLGVNLLNSSLQSRRDVFQ